jgi:hypothetical protein
MSATDKTLTELLGGEAPDILALPEDAKQKLAKDLQLARTAHEKHLKQAMDNALAQLPLLLRIPVKKLFGM